MFAEAIVGHRVLGHASRQNLGWSALESGRDWYFDWVGDLATYFGYSASGRIASAPEQCTWTGDRDEGNTGPCVAGREIYGVPALLFRYLLDRWGPTYPGGEAAMMRWMTQSPTSGFATLTGASGQRIELILTLFGNALFADGRYFDAFATWNLADIFSHLVANAQLQPYLAAGATPSLGVLVRGGSTAYLQWSPVAAHAPTSLRLRTPNDGILPADMVLWIVRVR